MANGQVKIATSLLDARTRFFQPRMKAMGRSVRPYRKLGGVLLAATTLVGLTIGAILAQSNPPGSVVSTQEEPIKRTILSGVIWRARWARRS